MKPKLLDVFLFYNELDLLKARLEYMGPIVDHFIISEANVDFSGRPKGFLLSQELVNTLPFADKIIITASTSILIRFPGYLKDSNTAIA